MSVRFLATYRAVGFSLLIGLWIVGSGCRSNEPGSTSHAHVQISGKSLPEIQQTTASVFRGEGYRMTVSQPPLQVFERLGSRREALKWGGLLSGGVVMRVKVAYTEVQDDVWLLQADAYAVQGAGGDPFFEDESRNILLNRHPYQKLLNKVEKQLK